MKEQLRCYKVIVGTIENNICAKLADDNVVQCSDAEVLSVANEICEKTLAFYLASDKEKELLTALFASIGKRIVNNKALIPKTSISLVDIDSSIKILNYIEKKQLNDVAYDCAHLLEICIELYNHINSEKTIDSTVCAFWIAGKTFHGISSELQIKVLDVEKQCENTISYHLSFMIGNVIDCLDELSPNKENLLLLQKQVKYGVDSQTAISICEKVFNERIIARKISIILYDDTIDEEHIINHIKAKRDDILEVIREYPSYFSNRLRLI